MLACKRRLLSLFTGLVLGIHANFSRPDAVDEYEIKAALVYKIALFTDWPKIQEKMNFCVYGKNPFGSALDHLDGKQFNKIKVVIKHPSALNELKSCQVLFLNPTDQHELAAWVASLEQWPTLTITDHPSGLNQGVMIVLGAEPNRVAFNVNLSAARKAGLDFQAQMLMLANSVY